MGKVTKADAGTTAVVVRKFPNELLCEVDERAREVAGDDAEPSRPRTIVDLVRRGLGVVRGDVGAGGTRRES